MASTRPTCRPPRPPRPDEQAVQYLRGVLVSKVLVHHVEAEGHGQDVEDEIGAATDTHPVGRAVHQCRADHGNDHDDQQGSEELASSRR